jgi:FkbM family methyltransferase
MIRAFLRLTSKLLSLHSHYVRFKSLKNMKFVVSFPLEGNIELSVNRIKFLNILQTRLHKEFRSTLNFADRTKAEPLLRSVARLLIEDEIPKQSVIIDIGSWIGDNSIVWAAICGSEQLVLAIDPSPFNLKFSQSIAKLNNLDNIVHVQAVCADEVNLPLEIESSHVIEHARFRLHSAHKDNTLLSTTIDKVVENHSRGIVSLLHIDVEGFEHKVLLGARKTIERDRPLILFEAHLLDDTAEEIFIYLGGFGYNIYMINEVLEGCRLDCRNFLALPNGNEISDHIFSSTIGHSVSFWPATTGPVLIRVA